MAECIESGVFFFSFSFLSLIFIIIFFFFFFSLFSILERNTRHRYLIAIIHEGVHPSSIIINEKENQKSQPGVKRSQGQVRSGQVKVSRIVTNPLYGVR